MARASVLILALFGFLLISGCADKSPAAALRARVQLADKAADKIEIYSVSHVPTYLSTRVKSERVYQKNSRKYRLLVADLISALEYKHAPFEMSDKWVVFKDQGRSILRLAYASRYRMFSAEKVEGTFLLPEEGRRLVE